MECTSYAVNFSPARTLKEEVIWKISSGLSPRVDIPLGRKVINISSPLLTKISQTRYNVDRYLITVYHNHPLQSYNSDH